MNPRILLVDDERSILEALSKVLRAEGYEIVLAENGQQAIEKHEAEHVDLLLLDLALNSLPFSIRARWHSAS